ncbi:hypothetical protein [Desulfuromonas sp.]|nr:hypothetical protein [Desulfuromonas sp.]
MRRANALNDYLTKTFLIGLFAAVGVTAAITAVLALWPPLAHLAGKFF